MLLKDLCESIGSVAPVDSVPDWMLGCFKRRSIAFANGQTDTETHVFWLQGRSLTIDLRLPVADEQVPAKAFSAYDAAELYRLADYEGWYADSTWQNEQLAWSGGTCFQLHNRWPEPALLQRVGDCMMEFSPLGTYVEDWRLKSRVPGPLLSLRLIQQDNLSTGETEHRDGALIITGDWAGLVLGRATPLEEVEVSAQKQLRDLVRERSDEAAFLEHVFNFETSVAHGSLENGFDIAFTTDPCRQGDMLFELDGFEFDPEAAEIVHRFSREGELIQRRFEVDACELSYSFNAQTGFAPEAKQWFDDEQQTLGRYLKAL